MKRIITAPDTGSVLKNKNVRECLLYLEKAIDAEVLRRYQNLLLYGISHPEMYKKNAKRT